VLNAVLTFQQQAQTQDPRRLVRWLAPSQIHLTLKFLGEVPEQDQEALASGLQRSCAQMPPFELSLGGLGCFPHSRRPRVFWVGLEGDVTELATLQAKVEHQLESWGPAEERAFRAHITIGRVKEASTAELRALQSLTSAVEPAVTVRWKIREVVLFRSELHPTGAVHHRLLAAPLSS
jgi:2'-5' RNA ligase